MAACSGGDDLGLNARNGNMATIENATAVNVKTANVTAVNVTAASGLVQSAERESAKQKSPKQKSPAQKSAASAPLQTTPLHDLHLALDAKLAAFAGYAMPIQYPLGVLGEHKHTRCAAGLFDVSHMGQARLVPNRKGENIAPLLEQLTPSDVATLKEGHMRYALLTNEAGGIRDDFMLTHIDGTFRLVVNAADKQANFAYLASCLAGRAVLEIEDHALLALQGPQAASILANIFPQSVRLRFMQATYVMWQGVRVLLSRCGYTGEDGFEISLPAERGMDFARLLLAQKQVAPIGLGARDSLRLEAGLCLYGQDIDATTTPVEANLLWTMPKHRLAAGNFSGAATINAQIRQCAPRLRVGIQPQTRVPARAGTEIQDKQARPIGKVTSGGFAPSLNTPISMGYVAPEYAARDTELNLCVRGKGLAAKITALPFVPHRYHRSKI